MSSKGKAKNDRKSSTAANDASSNQTPAMNTPSNADNNSNEPTRNGVTNWKRPVGVKGEKRKIEDSEFRRKKLKLLEKANNEAALCIAEARRANDIQEKLAKIDQDESHRLCILQDLNRCPNEAFCAYFQACKKEILDRFNQTATSSVNQQSNNTPLPVSDANLTGDPSDPLPSDSEECDHGHEDTNGDQPWLDPSLL